MVYQTIFYVPNFTSGRLPLKLSGLNSIEPDIASNKMLFLGRLISDLKMAHAVPDLFQIKAESFFEERIVSRRILPSF